MFGPSFTSTPCSNTIALRGADIAVLEDPKTGLSAVRWVVAADGIGPNNWLFSGAYPNVAAFPVGITCANNMLITVLPDADQIQNPRIAAPESNYPTSTDNHAVTYEIVNSGAGTQRINVDVYHLGTWISNTVNSLYSMSNCTVSNPVITYVRDNIIASWEYDFDPFCLSPVPGTPYFMSDYDVVVRNLNWNGSPINTVFYMVANQNTTGDQLVPSVAGRYLSNAGVNADAHYMWFNDNTSSIDYKRAFYTSSSLKWDIESLSDESTSEISVFPNPVIDELQIQTNDSSFEVLIYNNLGNIVQQEYSTNMIDLRNLNSGIYYLHYKSKSTEKRIKILK